MSISLSVAGEDLLWIKMCFDCKYKWSNKLLFYLSAIKPCGTWISSCKSIFNIY